MKTKIFIVVSLIFLFIGCAAHYGNEAQYDRGDWYLLASAGEVVRIKGDKLAFNKLKNAPAQTESKKNVPQGYKGLIANLSGHNRYNFKFTGPETKSFLLGPGEQVIDYLVPGKYFCEVYHGGSKIGSWSFKVGVQQSTFLNEKYHWYVYADR